MGISVLFLFPIKSCSAANHLTWTKFVGIQEMQKSFFFLTYETDDSQRGCPHWDQCQVTWEQFLAATYLEVDPRQVTWVTVLDTTWPQSRALRSWSSSQFTWKPFCCAFNKVLSPCLWLSGKLPFNSSRKKYPSKAIQFLKLRPFKFIGPY